MLEYESDGEYNDADAWLTGMEPPVDQQSREMQPPGFFDPQEGDQRQDYYGPDNLGQPWELGNAPEFSRLQNWHQREHNVGYGRHNPARFDTGWHQRSSPYVEESFIPNQRGVSLREAMSRPRRELLRDPFMLESAGIWENHGEQQQMTYTDARGGDGSRLREAQNYVSERQGAGRVEQDNGRNYSAGVRAPDDA